MERYQKFIAVIKELLSTILDDDGDSTMSEDFYKH